MGAAGKDVEALGGRTMRQSTRKVRNNKVYTTRGPRDRRLRLSADTAIQFYDVQDRLGYERASEAIDWLIEKAKDSILKLYGPSSHHYEHLAHLGAENGVMDDFLSETLSDREVEEAVHLQNFQRLADSSISMSGYNYEESSTSLPHIHMASYLPDHSFKMSYKTGNPGLTSPTSSSTLNHNDLPSYQQTAEQGQHSFMSNSAPLFLQPPTFGHNNDSSSAYISCLNHEPPGRESWDKATNSSSSLQSRDHYEQIAASDLPLILMPPSHHE